MSPGEPIVVPDGFRLVEDGLGPGTLRDPTRLRYWRGLSADDAALLYAWVVDRGSDLEELHTDVPCGIAPELEVGPADGSFARYVGKLHPLRIDAVVLLKGRWWIVEVKADAGYTALGQVLVYGWYATRTCVSLAGAALAVVTDRVQECIRPVFAELGVEVWEVEASPTSSGL